MFSVENLTIKIGDRKLINNLSFSVLEGDHLAIIGEEGNGKSSILKAIAKQTELATYASFEGKINISGVKVGYLEQMLNEKWLKYPVYSFFLKDNPDEDEDYERYSMFDNISKYISTFGLKSDLLESDQCIGELSGGEKVKLQLIKILISGADFLVLDEPTNDLDIEMLKWTENFIQHFKGSIVYISHDEMLLENTANAILHIEQVKKKSENRWTYAHVPYLEYIKKRAELLEKQTQVATYQRDQDKIRMEKWRQVYNRVDHELNTISRKDPHGARLLKKKMQSVKSQEKRFEKDRETFLEIPDTEESIMLNFGDNSIPQGKQVFDFEISELFNPHGVLLSRNIKLKVIGPKKIVIIGPNGIGKTTLLKKILYSLKSRTDLKVGYMPQNYNEEFRNYKTVSDFLFYNCDSKEEQTRARTFLACLKFTKYEFDQNIDSISGGQKAKLYLTRLMLHNYNVLILDEPTRNLSPLSCPVIREAILNFDGCVISISHDRKFINEIADVVYRLTSDGLIECTDEFE